MKKEDLIAMGLTEEQAGKRYGTYITYSTYTPKPKTPKTLDITGFAGIFPGFYGTQI